MKRKRHIVWIVIGILVIALVLPYVVVEIQSIDAEQKLASFDLSCFDNVYGEGTPEVYNRKIYSYYEGKCAKVLYVLGDCEFGVMVELEWNATDACWQLVDARNMWTVHGGSAQEFCWPLYYPDKVYPLLDHNG